MQRNNGTMAGGHFRCIIHGSFSKHFDIIRETIRTFQAAGIEILAPKLGTLLPGQHGFALFEDELGQDPRFIELLYLHNLKRLGDQGFSYFVDPEGYIGKSASYELGIAQLINTRCFFSHRPKDHPAYIPGSSIWKAESLADYIFTHQSLPPPLVKRREHHIHKLWEELMVPGSVVATGAIIEHQPTRGRGQKEVLLVKTHKWNNRYSIVGGKVRHNERLAQTLLREVKEETGLDGIIGRHIGTFDQLKNSGYYQSGIQHIFVDNVVGVGTRRVRLNDEAEDYIWALPSEALRHLDIEPNARKTLQLYSALV